MGWDHLKKRLEFMIKSDSLYHLVVVEKTQKKVRKGVPSKERDKIMS